MKRLAILLLVILCLICVFTACDNPTEQYTITSEQNSYNVTVGQQLDYKSYFTIVSSTGETVTVTDEMIDATQADLTKAGAFIVTCSYEGASKTIIFVVADDGGNQGGEAGGESDGNQGGESGSESGGNQGGDVASKDPITTTFNSAQMGFDESDGLTFSASPSPASFAEGRGLQFTQANGDATLTSASSLTGVTYVTVVVQTNQPLGMNVSVKVSNTSLTCDGNTTVLVAKTDYTVHNTLTFVASTAIDGKVEISLETTASDKSMYILQVVVGFGQAPTGEENPPSGETVDLSEIFAKYDDYDKWNFELDFTTGGGEYDTVTYYYGYEGWDAWLMYDYEGGTYVDYLVYVGEDMFLYYDNADGTHSKMSADSEDFYDYYMFDFLDLTQLGVSQYVENGEYYSATSPSAVGDAVLGEDFYAGATYVSFDVYVTDGNISKIVAVQSDGYTYTLEFYNHGKAEVDISKLDVVDDSTGGSEDGGNQGGGDQGGNDSPKEVMPEQSYDEATHDDGRLNDKIKEYYQGTNYDFSAGLPTTGNVNVLVVPVQFKNSDTFTTTELANLEIAFNGTEQQTGWESVKTYYQKASYGKLNLTFDIQSVFTASQNYTYYKEHTSVDESNYEYLDGTDVLLDEVLAWLDANVDFSVYDQLDDGCIDAVYLIYCENVDYRESWEIPNDEINPDFFWAYVTWSYSEQKYDNLYPYTHMFAGVDFMTEDVTNDGKLLVNAVTYIHETGHVLGLDDYYDYYETQGSNEGLGGADMMDHTVGDHNAYSKIMLDWLTPTIVTSTQQITLTANTSTTNGGVVMLLLDYNETYFSEYLLIEFYSATGLNEFHANASESYLYDGAQYGVRIYHVDSTVSNPYNDDYGSFTDNNNSITKDPLIKLVEADGDKNFESSGGYASAGDLWQTGDVFSEIQANYTRNDGKLVNFDIEFVSVTAEGATISITFDVAE